MSEHNRLEDVEQDCNICDDIHKYSSFGITAYDFKQLSTQKRDYNDKFDLQRNQNLSK